VPMRQFICDVELDPAMDPAQRPWTGLAGFHVTALNYVADDVLEVTLAAQDGRRLPDYRPGQHITLEVDLDGDTTLTRSYSLVGPAREHERHTFRIAVRRQIGRTEHGDEWIGAFSGHLHTQICVGDALRVGGPSGNFVIPERSPQPVVLFAGGIGITPFLSYLESLKGADDMPEVQLHYANRNGRTTAYGERLQELARGLPRLSVTYYYNEPLPTDIGAHEALDAHVVSDELIQARARFYMCGPPGMMDSLRDGLTARGVPSFDIFHEIFRSPPVVNLAESGPFDVRFAQSDNLTATWTPKGGTLLSFAEKQGLTLPSGCRVGQCESCAVKVVSGQVRHLHGVEPDDPSVCLTCQAIPTSDLVLEA
jgi:ferredoxin-NADP reductase